jgi:hypothetical protein
MRTGTVTLGELAVLIGSLAVTVVALAGLAAAHLHHYSLGLALAGALAGLLVLAAAWWLARPAPRIVLDLPGLLVLVGAGLLALFMFLPGFHYGAGDRDPGGYMMVGSSIARTGSVSFTDPLLTSGLPVVTPGGGRFPGIWIDDRASGQITPQFYHLWSALLATAYKLHGFAGASNATPLVGVLAVLLLVCVARRLGGLLAAVATGLLISTHMMQVWQAKYPSAEIFTQMIYLAAVLGLVIALQTRWRWPAFAAGALVGAAWLARADGVLLVLLAVACGAALYVLRRLDARGWWFAAGLVPTGLYAAYQAYGPAVGYTRVTVVPGLGTVLGLVAFCVLGALLLRPVADRLARRLAGRRTDEIEVSRRWQLRTGYAVVGLTVALFVLGLCRPLLGSDYVNYRGTMVRTYDEHSLHRLSWFFTWPGLLLILVGVAAVALRRWRPETWVITLPTLLLLPLFGSHAHNSAFLMWWGRRYVSYLVPGMVLLAVLGLVAIWQLGRRVVDRLGADRPARSAAARLAGPLVATGLAAFLAVVYLGQSLPVRQHDEWGGTYGLAQNLAALGGGRQGVYMWQPSRACCGLSVLAGPMWLEQGQISTPLPAGDPAQVVEYVHEYLQYFRDRPVFLVYPWQTAPVLPGLTLTRVRNFAGKLPHWAESPLKRPDRAVQVPYAFTVYRVAQSG